MTLDQLIELSHHAGVAAAIWIAIRADLKVLHWRMQQQEKRLDCLERESNRSINHGYATRERR